jgi:hypothetical protein
MCRHPNIVSLKEAYESSEEIAIVMELYVLRNIVRISFSAFPFGCKEKEYNVDVLFP